MNSQAGKIYAQGGEDITLAALPSDSLIFLLQFIASFLKIAQIMAFGKQNVYDLARRMVIVCVYALLRWRHGGRMPV